MDSIWGMARAGSATRQRLELAEKWRRCNAETIISHSQERPGLYGSKCPKGSGKHGCVRQ